MYMSIYSDAILCITSSPQSKVRIYWKAATFHVVLLHRELYLRKGMPFLSTNHVALSHLHAEKHNHKIEVSDASQCHVLFSGKSCCA